MKYLRLILFISLCHHIALADFDYDQFNSQSQQLTLTDWDSTLYGKPICVPIPANMSLCANINYSQMKTPNLLGHETIEEIVYQSSVWQPLISVNCHKDTQLFLCSLFAPVCVEQESALIYPCRSLCESVKNSCEGPMLSYNYPWPSMFNCSRFPVDNGLCIQSFDQSSSSSSLPSFITTTAPTTTTTTTTTATTTSTRRPSLSRRPIGEKKSRKPKNKGI